ncbi:MAG: adenylate/guanylate cyclase domain-containing protein, partial [Acidiferrobacteraceae bacterium]|nr:adenylate/guanylate cyclase domain-containing protein [Acidiferrobacteraceae bacterium]
MGETKEKTERVLLAVLHGDIVEFSRLTWQDEEATFHALKEGFAHARIVITNNGGQLVNTAGDSLLAVFPTASAAAITAIALHKRLAVANENVPEHQCLRARIGINLGEVIVDGDQAFGNGVNIAARLQEIAPPGGICISQSAREVIGDSLDVCFESIGDQLLRNIAVPVHAHLLHTDYEITQREG